MTIASRSHPGALSFDISEQEIALAAGLELKHLTRPRRSLGAKLANAKMTSRSFSRLTQVFWTAVFIGSLAACSDVKLSHTDPNAQRAVAPASHTATTGATPSADPSTASPAASAAPNTKTTPDTAAASTKPSALDSEISGLRPQVAARRQYNEELRNFVAAKEKQLAAVLASDRSAGPSAQEFDLRTSITSKMAEIDRESPAWQQKIDAHKAVLSKASDDPHASDLQKQIDDFSEQRAELLRLRAKLAALPDQLKGTTTPAIKK